MKRFAKWLGIGVAGLVALVVVLSSGFYARGLMVAGEDLAIEGRPVSVPAEADAALLARGEHVATHIAQCVTCHQPDLGGGEFINDPMFAVLPAPNLTTGDGGIGSADDATLERAIRHGVGVDGRPLYIMPSVGYQYMSDRDLAAVIAFIRSHPPVDRQVGDRSFGPIAGILAGLGQVKSAYQLVDHDAAAEAMPPEGPTAEYGRYLTRIGACMDCHGPELTGGPAHGAVAPPNITAADGGAGSWTLEQFTHLLREGERPDGRRLDPTEMPWPRFGGMTDTEIEAIWQYLRTSGA